MTNIARIAFRQAWEGLSAVVREITGSNYATLTTTRNGDLLKKSQKKVKIKAKVTMPSKRITDPGFQYKNSAQTDVAERFKNLTGVKDVHGLQQHSDASREQDEKFVSKVSESKIRRLRG
jgi:hypothetical protein